MHQSQFLFTLSIFNSNIIILLQLEPMVEHAVAAMDIKGPGVVVPATTATASSSTTTAPPHAQASADIITDLKVLSLAF